MIIGVFGLQGEGKSLFCGSLCHFLSREYGVRIYTNANMRCEHVHISKVSQIPADLGTKVLWMDEAMFSLDSRLFSSKDSVRFTKFLALLRKQRTHFVFSTHRPNMVDKRLREQMDLVVYCRKREDLFTYLMFDSMLLNSRSIVVPVDDSYFDYSCIDTLDFPEIVEVDSIFRKY